VEGQLLKVIPSSTIEEIRNKADIVELVSEYVQLKKRGKNYVGLCPFHSERTPSFTVSPEKKLFHCFGCSEGGNIFAFLMKMEKMDFVEAVKHLGGKLGIRIEEQVTKKRDKGKDKHYKVVSLAEKFYNEALLSSSGKDAREYLEKRGIDLKTIKEFSLGFAPEGWDALTKHLIQRGAAPEDIAASGLALKREGGSGFYDRFRNRIIFPIFNHRGIPLGFGGRGLKNEEPKYINSPDTPIYNKGYVLYGLNFAKDEIRRRGYAIIVEGYMDLIACSQFGIKNTVASLGTALTESQAKLLLRSANKIVLAFDADKAGELAAERSVEMLKFLGAEVKVAINSEGKDPDELIRKKGGKEFENTIKDAIPWAGFKINMILRKYDVQDIEQKAKAAREIFPIIAKEKDSIIRAEYMKILGEKLKLDKELILSEVKKAGFYKGKSRKRPDYQRSIIERPKPKIYKAEEIVLKFSAENEGAQKLLQENLDPTDFTDKSHREIAEIIISTDFSDKSDRVHFLTENLPNEEAKKILSKMLLSEDETGYNEKIFIDCLNAIKAHHLKSRMEKLKEEMKAAEDSREVERVNELHKEFSECSKELRTLARS